MKRHPPIFEADSAEAHRDEDRVAIEVRCRANIAMVFRFTVKDAYDLLTQLSRAVHAPGEGPTAAGR